MDLLGDLANTSIHFYEPLHIITGQISRTNKMDSNDEIEREPDAGAVSDEIKESELLDDDDEDEPECVDSMGETAEDDDEQNGAKSIGLNGRLSHLESSVASLRDLLRDQIVLMRAWRSKVETPNQTKFKVPREHPKFNGKREKLEEFILDMELSHSEFTMGEEAKQNNRAFIQQLGPYFEGPAKTWFRLYASRRAQKNFVLSWEKLVRDLRQDFGGKHEAETRFNEYFQIKQKTDVNTYIAEKTAAARLAEADLTPSAMLYGFLSGLKGDVQDYVRLQCPRDLRGAEELARAYENNLKNRKRKAETKSEDDDSTLKPDSRKAKARHLERQRALRELRELRRNRCFGCGQEGHRRDTCKATAVDIEKFQAKIEAVKKKLGRSESDKA